MDGLFLDNDELRTLTGFAIKSKQCQALAEMRIPYRRRPDGKPMVVRSDLSQDQRARRTPEPDYEAI